MELMMPMHDWKNAAAGAARLAGAAALALGLAAGALPVTSAAADQVTWKFAQTTPIPGTVWHRYATEILPQRIEAVTDGQVKVEVISGVVQPGDLLRGIRDGEVQGGALLFPYVGPTLPLWNVLSLPGLVTDESQYPALVNELVMPVIAADSRDRFGAVPVVVATFPGAYFFSNGPIDSLEKMRGTKYRAHSPELVQIVQAAGGTAVSMPFGELYGALQRRMVDAYTSALTTVSAAKLDEVTNYAENWPGGMGTWGYFLSEEALSRLTADQRQRIEAAMAEMNAEIQAVSLDEVETATATLRERGMTFVDIGAEERQKAVDLAKDKVWSAWLGNTGDAGAQLLKQVQDAQE